MTKASNRRLATAFLFLWSGTIFSGCGDLSAVRDFAKISYQAADYTYLVDEYIGYPTRLKTYAPEGKQAALDEQHKARQAQRQGLLALHARVQDYMEALGQLAADETVSFDKEFAGLETVLTDASFASQPQAKAAGELGQLLAKAATDTWRRKKITVLIEEANAPLQTVLDGIDRTLMDAFLADLDDEDQTMGRFYAALQKESADKAGVRSLQEWRQSHQAKLEQNRRAIQVYAKTIHTIKEGHQKLYDERNDLHKESVVAQIRAYVTQLKSLEKTLRALR